MNNANITFKKANITETNLVDKYTFSIDCTRFLGKVDCLVLDSVEAIFTNANDIPISVLYIRNDITITRDWSVLPSTNVLFLLSSFEHSKESYHQRQLTPT